MRVNFTGDIARAGATKQFQENADAARSIFSINNNKFTLLETFLDIFEKTKIDQKIVHTSGDTT